MEKRKVSYEELLGLVKKPILHPPPEPVHDGTPMTSDERGAELPESIMSSTLNDAPLDAQNKLSLDFNKLDLYVIVAQSEEIFNKWRNKHCISL